MFNGDNKVPHLFVNGLQPLADSIEYHKLSEEDAKGFLIFLMDTAIRLQQFSNDSRTRGKLIDYPLMYCKVTGENVSDPVFIKLESDGTLSYHQTLEKSGGAVKR